LALFTLSAGCAGFLSAEATAVTLGVLVLFAACCRGPIRLELVLAGIVALAARYSGGDWEMFKKCFFALMPLVIAMGGWYITSRAVFGPRRHRHCSCRRRGRWWQQRRVLPNDHKKRRNILAFFYDD